MTGRAIDDLRRATFRASRAFDLVVFDRLPQDEQAALTEMRHDPSFYGVLRPRESRALTVKTVDRDTALLWLTLAEPGPVPAFVWQDDVDAAGLGLRRLVLDGVLEIGHDGTYVSGPSAVAAFSDLRDAAPSARLAALSHAALAYAEGLRLDDAELLARRIYEFGRQPLTRAWSKALPGAEAVLAHVGAAGGSRLERQLNATWRRSDEARGWIAWSKAGPDSGVAPDHRPTYKLYVSPTISDLPDAVEAVATLGRVAPAHFKIGADAAGVLRPDKLVLYFQTLESLHEAAAALQRTLEGATPHGVPFSAEIAGDGLLSWGMDPPRAARLVSWQEAESWRLWVARRLGAAMVAAHALPASHVGPAHFAIERLRHEGVDVVGWQPSAALWQRG